MSPISLIWVSVYFGLIGYTAHTQNQASALDAASEGIFAGITVSVVLGIAGILAIASEYRLTHSKARSEYSDSENRLQAMSFLLICLSSGIATFCLCVLQSTNTEVEQSASLTTGQIVGALVAGIIAAGIGILVNVSFRDVIGRGRWG